MRRAPLLLAACAALLLTGCTGDDPAGTGAATGGDANGAPATSAPPPEPVGPLEPATAECLTGTWRLDLPTMQDDLRRLVASDEGVEVEVAGTTTYEFGADGTFRASVDSSSSLTMAAEGSELTSTTTSTGDLTATWSLAGDLLTIADVDADGLQVTTRASLDGEDIDVPPATPEDAVEALPPTSSTASCGASAATLVMPLVEDEDSEPVEITYTLRR